MTSNIKSLFLDNPCLSAQVSAFCASLPEYKAAERAYYAAEQDLEDRLGYEAFDRFSEVQFRYVNQLAHAYYLFGLGLRQEVLRALGGATPL